MYIHFPDKQAIIDFISTQHDPFLNSNDHNLHILTHTLASILAGKKTTAPEIKFDIEIKTYQLMSNSTDHITLQKIKKNLMHILIECATENSNKN